MQATPVAGYGRYNQITIVRYQSWGAGQKFYILVDKNSERIGRSFEYLVNARKEATRLLKTEAFR